MIRLFQRHKKRKIYSIDGMWRFKPDPEKNGLHLRWFQSFPEDATEIVVPSCWNNELGLYEYEGAAWYCTEFVTKLPNINLCFHGVTGQAEIYVDGVHVGGHYGSFTGFDITVRGLAQGKHQLVVFVDNTHNDTDTFPLAKVDWFHYGGIFRSVEIMELGGLWIKSYRINYQLNETMTNVMLEMDINIENIEFATIERELKIYINDKLVNRTAVTLKRDTTVRIDGISLENIRLWELDNPILYYVKMEIDEDDIIERIGFREIKAYDRKIYLNGKEIFLKGINRHEDHPDWGFAIPFKLMKRDMDIIKDMGCNSIRGSHYPNAEVFLDYCDQKGILFWEEIPMWQFFDRHFNNPLVVQRGMVMLEEMITRDYHHPCIIIWSVHNEVETDVESCYKMTEIFVKKVRSLDSDRLVTYASNKDIRDRCFSLVDLVCINKYLGWYENKLESWDDFLKSLKGKLTKEKLDHLPILISEFGAGALYGEITFEGAKWTENFQNKYLDFALNLFLNDPDICGTYIWQYCDIRTPVGNELERPRCYNNKGIVNEYRKPKMAYWTVKRFYNDYQKIE